ncbi:hypothetical protein LSAT2_030622 [Lamellibrachia satsuma]|nr:hypothetical protein LSAT2_030622 [Lamellibrachia satsuma]
MSHQPPRRTIQVTVHNDRKTASTRCAQRKLFTAQQHKHTDEQYPGDNCTSKMANVRGLLVLSLVCLLLCQMMSLSEACAKKKRSVNCLGAPLSAVNQGVSASVTANVLKKHLGRFQASNLQRSVE